MKNILIAFAIVLSFVSLNSYAVEKKEWTFLVFINGNNSLDEFGAQNINQMEAVGSSNDLNIVVQWASLDRGVTQRILVQKDNKPNEVTSPVLEQIGNPDMGDYRTLEEFAKWAMEKYPAKKYFLNVWNHGSGWRYMSLSKKDSGAHINDISWDDNTGNSITTKQLGLAIKHISEYAGQKLDVYASDACLMAMVEVAGEMDGSIQYYAGSQDLEPGAGWPYDKFLGRLKANPQMSARDLTIALTEEYAKNYERNPAITFSSFDMNGYSALRNNLKELGSEISRLSAADKNKIFAAAKRAQEFEYSDYGDLADFLNEIKKSNVSSLNNKLVDDTHKATLDFVVINKFGRGFPNANGVSIWLPKDISSLNSFKQKYSDLLFNTETNWLSTLTSFVVR